MTQSENELKVLKNHLRSCVGEGREVFKCLPACGFELEAVHLCACAAQLGRYWVSFHRWGSAVFDEPEQLTWRMQLENKRGQLLWKVDRTGRALRSEEFAHAILEQLYDIPQITTEKFSHFMTDESR